MRRVTTLIVTCALTIGLAAAVSPTPAQAVTYGSYVTKPATSAPWVLSIYYAEDGKAVPEFTCTGTALNRRVILTAAHCVQDEGFYFIRVGADVLGTGTLIPIEGIFDNSRYSALKLVNDIALMRPLTALPLSKFPRLANSTLASRIRGTRPPALRLYGWGLNQNGVLTKRLTTASLRPQTRAAQRAYKTQFKSSLMLGAGRYIRKTDTYAGGCYGDSGGPLVTTVNGVLYVVGVTAFGMRGCNLRVPTVFTSVGNYRAWLKIAYVALPRSANTDNRALPVNHVPPAIDGTAGLGNTLTCAGGSWSSNTNSTSFSWQRGTTVLSASQTYVVTEADGGKDLVCKVTAQSDAGPVTLATPPLAVPAVPSTSVRPALSGIATSGMPDPGTVVTCTAPVYEQPDVVTSISWSSSSSSNPGTVIASGSSLVLTAELLRSLAGTYLVCTARGENSMGADATSTARMIPRLAVPAISISFSVAPTTAIQPGSVASCAVRNGEGTTITYEWAVQPALPTGQTFAEGATQLNGSGATYTVTSSDMDVLRGKYLACRATATTWQGSDAAVAGRYVS